MAFLPLLILAPGWAWAPKTTRSVIFLSLLSVLFLTVEAAIIRAVVRMLPKEEGGIAKFLFSLFPEANMNEKSPGKEPATGA